MQWYNVRKTQKKKLFFSSSIQGPEHSTHSGRFGPNIVIVFDYSNFWIFLTSHKVTSCKYKNLHRSQVFHSLKCRIYGIVLQKIKAKSSTVQDWGRNQIRHYRICSLLCGGNRLFLGFSLFHSISPLESLEFEFTTWIDRIQFHHSIESLKFHTHTHTDCSIKFVQKSSQSSFCWSHSGLRKNIFFYSKASLLSAFYVLDQAPTEQLVKYKKLYRMGSNLSYIFFFFCY